MPTCTLIIRPIAHQTLIRRDIANIIPVIMAIVPSQNKLIPGNSIASSTTKSLLGTFNATSTGKVALPENDLANIRSRSSEAGSIDENRIDRPSSGT